MYKNLKLGFTFSRGCDVTVMLLHQGSKKKAYGPLYLCKVIDQHQLSISGRGRCTTGTYSDGHSTGHRPRIALEEFVKWCRLKRAKDK